MGKFVNARQTCVAPDYVLVLDKIVVDFVEHLRTAVNDFYGDDPKASPDFPRIINEHHFDRIIGLIDSGNIAFGGETDHAGCYIAPTVLMDTPPDSPIMSEEIFGPIPPVLTVFNIEEAIAFVNERSKPLALYLFSNNKETRDKVIDETSSGCFARKAVDRHLVVPELPFGGVGPSGMGAYHGYASFRTFSHAKGVLPKSEHFEIPLRYPPYTDSKFKWLKRLT